MREEGPLRPGCAGLVVTGHERSTAACSQTNTEPSPCPYQTYRIGHSRSSTRCRAASQSSRAAPEASARRSVAVAEAGADVVIADLDETLAGEVAQQIASEYGHRTVGMTVDVADEASDDALADRAVAELGGIHIWVNNAGIYPSTPFLEMGPADWDKVLDINLRGTYLGARAAASAMSDAGGAGVIINLASTAGYKAAGPGVAHYVASKHAVRGLTKSLAVELGPLGIRALAIAPTLVETPGIEAGRTAFEEAGLGDMLAQMADLAPLRRNGVPDDVARVALFCASDMSILMTGSTLPVDAGDLAT